MNIHSTVLLLSTIWLLWLFAPHANASTYSLSPGEQANTTETLNRSTILKGEIQEFGQTASIWQQLNTRLIQGNCQLAPSVSQLAKITVNKNLVPTTLITNSRAFSGQASNVVLTGIHPGMRRTGIPILTGHSQTVYNKTIRASALLAECIPPPTDSFGRNQWDLLDQELHFTHLYDEWRQWTDSLGIILLNRWRQTLAADGASSFHLTVYRSGQIDIKTLYAHAHGYTRPVPSEDEAFKQTARSVLYCLAGSPYLRFPSDSQVQEVHLEIQLDRQEVTPQ
jgi:hypothetical protein